MWCWMVSPVRVYLSHENVVINLVPMTILKHIIGQLELYTRCAKQFEESSKNTPQYCVKQQYIYVLPPPAHTALFKRRRISKILVKLSFCAVCIRKEMIMVYIFRKDEKCISVYTDAAKCIWYVSLVHIFHFSNHFC